MKNVKKLIPYLINSLIVITIFIIVLLITKTSPFGNNILGKADAITQYKPMLYNFIMSIKKGTFTIYSFNNGLGNSFLFTFIYYLSSPINLIALLFNKPDSMFLAVIITKLILTTVNITFYTNKKTNKPFVSLIASISYIFSSWFIAYYYNIMWLDAFMIFPLFQYGIEKLTDHNQPLIYILTSTYLIITNFFLAFSSLVYGLVYYIIKKYFYQEKNFKEKLKDSLFYLLANLAILLLIAIFIQILFTIKNQTNLAFGSEGGDYLLSTTDFFKSIFIGNINLIQTSKGQTFPNIAVNTFILINIIYYFFNKKITTKDKIFTLITIVLIILTFFIKQFDYVLNMFHNVNGLTYRYTFIYIFLAITLFIKNIINYNSKSFKKIPIIAIILIGILLINYQQMSHYLFYINLISLVIISIIAITYKEHFIYKTIIVLLIITQSILTTSVNLKTDISKDLENNNVPFQTEQVHYRLNTLSENDYFNHNLYYNQKVTNLFQSLTYNNVIDLAIATGCQAGTSTITCDDNNLLFSLLFNVKKELYLEKIYAVNKDLTKVILVPNNIKYNNEEIIKKMTSIEDIYIKKTIKGELKDGLYYYEPNLNYYLIDIKNEDFTENLSQTYTTFKMKEKDSNGEETIYILKDDKLKDIYNYLSKNQINYTHYQDDYLEGTINIDENQIIFTSIPYDEAWEIKVDNKIVKPIRLLDSLIGIEVEPGKHHISLKYKYKFHLGLTISLISIIILLIICLYPKKKKI